TFEFQNMKCANDTSSDPYFEYKGFDSFQREGHWRLIWELSWSNCTEGAVSFSRTRRSVVFTTQNGAQEVDLVTPTTKKTCNEPSGFALNVTETMPVSPGANWNGGDTCTALAPTAPKLDACPVEVNYTAAASISSSI
ncbi:hypothetical protein BU23DRAFT_432487, partial [Bimuria novae-zelandiae CBS 107.79]